MSALQPAMSRGQLSQHQVVGALEGRGAGGGVFRVHSARGQGISEKLSLQGPCGEVKKKG